MKAIGRLIKSIGLSTRIIEVRSFTSIIPPRTMPNIIGTIGRLSLLRMKPSKPKKPAIAQSIELLRKL